MSGADIFLGQIRKGKTRGERNRSVFCDVAKEGAGFFPEAEHPHTAGLAFCLTDPEQNEKKAAADPGKRILPGLNQCRELLEPGVLVQAAADPVGQILIDIDIFQQLVLIIEKRSVKQNVKVLREYITPALQLRFQKRQGRGGELCLPFLGERHIMLPKDGADGGSGGKCTALCMRRIRTVSSVRGLSPETDAGRYSMIASQPPDREDLHGAVLPQDRFLIFNRKNVIRLPKDLR